MGGEWRVCTSFVFWVVYIGVRNDRPGAGKVGGGRRKVREGWFYVLCISSYRYYTLSTFLTPKVI